MKKIVALILCLFMCFSLAACSFSWDEQTSITSASVVYDEKADKYYLELVYESGDVSRIRGNGFKRVARRFRLERR